MREAETVKKKNRPGSIYTRLAGNEQG